MDKILFSTRLAQKRKSMFKNQTLFAKEYIKRFPPKRRDEAGGNEGNYQGILGTIKNYENPNHNCRPNLETVDNMCNILGCDVDYLLGKIDYETHNLKFVCEYTGLSEASVEYLKKYHDWGNDIFVQTVLNNLLSSDILPDIGNALLQASCSAKIAEQKESDFDTVSMPYLLLGSIDPTYKDLPDGIIPINASDATHFYKEYVSRLFWQFIEYDLSSRSEEESVKK